MRHLYYGDNLDVLKRHIKDESVDLVYLDPPFKSNRDYNILFKQKNGDEAASQILAFEDTWSWGADDLLLYESMLVDPSVPSKMRTMLSSMYAFLGGSDMMSYLVMMAPRLLQLRRVMKPTASIYLHCDCSASHYLKMLMDGVFGPENFRNEIIWKRKAGRGETNNKAIRFGVSHDIILFYSRAGKSFFNSQFRESNEAYIKSKFTHDDGDGRIYRLDNLTSPSPRPNLCYEYKGYKPPKNGWAVSIERMKAMEEEGRIFFPDDFSKRLQRKRFLDELQGENVDSLWDDISPLNSQAKERLGYPTQKPVALLKRIIESSSNEGDVVLDPFCGCGTAIVAAEQTKRSWIGIDITQLSIAVIKQQLSRYFDLKALTNERKGADSEDTYRVKGEPTTLEEALVLKTEDPHQCEYWALGLVGARPKEEKKGADRGIDGIINFVGDDGKSLETIIISVKSGHVKRGYMHELRGVVDREKAAMGVLITFEKPTKNMIEESILGGFYESKTWGKKYQRLQILTIEDIMNGKGVDMPPIDRVNATYIKAQKGEHGPRQLKLKLK